MPVFRKNLVLILFETRDEFAITTVTCGYLKFHYKNLISLFVIHNETMFRRIYTQNTTSSNANIWKYNVTRMSILTVTGWTQSDLLIRSPSGYPKVDVLMFLTCMSRICVHTHTCTICNWGTRQIQSWPSHAAHLKHKWIAVTWLHEKVLLFNRTGFWHIVQQAYLKMNLFQVTSSNVYSLWPSDTICRQRS